MTDVAEAAHIFAQHLIEADAEIDLDAAQAIMKPAAFQAFCEALDMCHVHLQDIENCADDDRPECRSFR